MMNHLKKEPRDRILEAASSLFARKGFSAVGVREIAATANVNLSMISYYFEGKMGILKAIIEEYFLALSSIFTKIADKNLGPEDSIRELIKAQVRLIREKEDLCKVAIIELPLDIPEVKEYKYKMLMEHIKHVKSSMCNFYPFIEDPRQHMIIGPALVSLIFSNFLVGNMAKDMGRIQFDDEFYAMYIDTITTMYLYGVNGLTSQNNKNETIF